MNFNFRCALSVLPLALAWCHHPPCRSRRLLSTDAEVVQTLMGCKGRPNHSEGHWSSLPALNACQQAYMCYEATLSLVHNFLGHFQKENSGFGGTLHPSLLGLHRSCSPLLSPDSAEAQTMTHCGSHSPHGLRHQLRWHFKSTAIFPAQLHSLGNCINKDTLCI